MFGRKKDPSPVVVPAEAPEEPKGFVPLNVTKIGPGITMVGNFEGADPVEINGTLQGNISSSQMLTISKSGSLQGDGFVETMVLSGTVNGTIECQRAAHLTATGVLDGNLYTQTLQTDDGSEITGTLKLQKKAKTAAAPSAEATTEK